MTVLQKLLYATLVRLNLLQRLSFVIVSLASAFCHLVKVITEGTQEIAPF